MECLINQLLELAWLLGFVFVVLPISAAISVGLIYVIERLRGNRIQW